ncbi:MAG: ABC transporter ATP-binding protein [Candidatus Margulisbacteria bacterium]|nr:ABC transporter ATP-binding protein [Candidatus Margulisiibacteriota bacterium]
MVLFSVASVYFIPLIRDITQEVSNKNLAHFHNHIINAFFLSALWITTKYGIRFLSAHLAYKVLTKLRQDLFQKLNHLSMDFHQNHRIGDLNSRLFSDTDKIFQSLGIILEQFLPNILILLGTITYLSINISWKLTLFSIVAMPLFVYIVMELGKKIKKASGKVQKKLADLNHYSYETLQNIAVVKAFTNEPLVNKRFKKLNDINFLAYMREIKHIIMMEPRILFLQYSSFIIILWYGGSMVVAGDITGPELLSFFSGILLLIDPVLAISKVYGAIQQANAAADRIFSILDTPSTIKNTSKSISPKTIKGAFEFNKVSFSYESSKLEAITNLSLHVKPGKTVALVGSSGAGKSTLINLILRFYDPTSGIITMDGINLKDITIRWLRSHIGYVPQDDILFRGNILDNIRYGNPSSSEKEVIHALKQANAWEFIERLPDKLLTKIGDQGKKLSGGQKQRLSIARAVIRNPHILILDEATSSLDAKSEKLVQDAILKFIKNRTTFVIAHRLSTIMHADTIVVLDHGQILETGTHSDLILKKGHYYKLFNTQFQKT